MAAQAYTFANLTFCEPCALLNTGVGLILSGLGRPLDMDDAIARMALGQVSRGMDIETPIAVSQDATGTCDNCGRVYAPRQPEGSDAA